MGNEVMRIFEGIDCSCRDGLVATVTYIYLHMYVVHIRIHIYMGDFQNYGPFLGPYYNTGPNTGPNLGDPKRDHNFDNPPYRV